MAKSKTKSPLRSAPLRVPGQSVQEQLDHLLNDIFVDHLVLIMITFIMLLTSLIILAFGTPPQIMVVVTGLFFITSLIYAVPKMRKAVKKAKDLKLGRDGERAVAEYLDTLRNENCRVLHDLKGNNFNLDHVVVTSQGVFTIETKTMSKPERGDVKVVYDGENITVGGFKPDCNPVTQAKAQASWLRTLLKDMTGKDYPVRPVVVYPGWFVGRTNKDKGREVWVIEPKSLGGFIAQEPIQITASDVALASNALKRHVRLS
ncbi:hypothetical protein BH24DEI2_BH24DEI2_05940 [soil metagenome]